MNLSASLTRRHFLRQSALASSLLILPRGLWAAGNKSPNDRLRIALVGVGGRGHAALAGLQDEEFVAFCDVDEVQGRAKVVENKSAGAVLAAHPGAKWFKDYRIMFEEMADKIDAVVVCTPDHLHYPIALAAIRHGKHVFVEKPLCRCLSEVRALQLAAREAGVVSQMGNQGRASEGIRLAREWIQAGLIGRVHTVHAYTDRPRLPWFHDAAFDPDAGVPDEPVPATLDWDLWLGPSPMRPYRSAFVPGKWRGFVDYGCGSLGDMGCHQIDAAFYALDLGPPDSIEAATTTLYPKTFPRSVAITYKFPARGAQPPVELKWFDGGLQPPRPPEVSPEEWQVPAENGGSLFYGDRGAMWVSSHSRSVRLLPEARMKELASSRPDKTIPRIPSGDHYKEWTRAIRGGPACGSQFEYGAALSEVVLLGVAATRARTRLEWDSRTLTFPNAPALNHLAGPGYAYRAGWGV
jgi:predicted dehydrogenase